MIYKRESFKKDIRAFLSYLKFFFMERTWLKEILNTIILFLKYSNLPALFGKWAKSVLYIYIEIFPFLNRVEENDTSAPCYVLLFYCNHLLWLYFVIRGLFGLPNPTKFPTHGSEPHVLDQMPSYMPLIAQLHNFHRNPYHDEN